MDFYCLQALTSRGIQYVDGGTLTSPHWGIFLHLKEEMLRMEQDTSALDNLAYIWLWQFFKPRNIPADQFRGLRTKVIFHTHHNSDKLTMKQTLHINDKLYTPL